MTFYTSVILFSTSIYWMEFGVCRYRIIIIAFDSSSIFYLSIYFGVDGLRSYCHNVFIFYLTRYLHISFSSEINVHWVFFVIVVVVVAFYLIYLDCSISFGWFKWLKKILCNNFYFGDISIFTYTFSCTVAIVKLQTFTNRIFHQNQTI